MEQQQIVLLLLGAAAATLVLVAAWQMHRGLKSWRKTRLARLDRLSVPEAAPPGVVAEHQARHIAQRSVDKRFSVLRRMGLFVLLALALLLAVFPLLGGLPQALVSLVAAVLVAIFGIAAKPWLENLISGVVISLSHMVRLGDTVLIDNDQYGTVEDITMTHTVVKLWDWRRYIVPNSRMLAKEFVNYTHRDSWLWTYVEFQVDRDVDVGHLRSLAVAAARQSPYTLDHGEPELWVRAFAPNHLTCWLAAWAKDPEAAWYLRADLRERLVQALDGAGMRGQTTHIELWERRAQGA